MTDFKKDMARIQSLVGDAFSATGGLVALSDGGVMSEQKLQQNKIPYEEGSQLVFQLKSLIKESNEWSFFKRHFEKVHPDFFLLLKESCPQLSENDLRLCALIRTGMSNKEIAQMLGISLNTVFTTRYRIRKKLGNLLKGNNPDKESSLSEENELEEHSLEDFLRKL